MMYVATPQSTAARPGPLLTAPVLIFAGDSQTADSYGAGATYTASHVNWLRTATRHRYAYDPATDLFATAGYTTANWITTYLSPCVSRCQSVSSSGATPVVVVRLGANDVGAGRSVADTTADLDRVVTSLHDAGALTVVYPVHPRSGSSALSTVQETRRQAVNRHIADYGRTPGLGACTVDTLSLVVDASTGAARSGYQRDGLHETGLGAEAAVKPVAALLNALAPDVLRPFLDADDVFDAVENPFGSKLVNGLFAGTTGVRSQGVTGDVAAGWTASLFNGDGTGPATALTAACAKTVGVTIAGLPMQQVTLGGAAGGGESFRLTQSVPKTGYAAGDRLELGVMLEWDDGLTNVNAAPLLFSAGYPNQLFELAGGAAYGPLPSGARSLAVVTTPLKLASATGSLDVRLSVAAQANTSPVSGVLRFSQAWVRKLA